MGDDGGRRDDDLAIFGAPSRFELGLAIAALLIGLVLLASFYRVTQQAVERGPSRWSQALQRAPACRAPAGVDSADRCAAPLTAAFDGRAVGQVAR